jgi:hypothetical protein
VKELVKSAVIVRVVVVNAVGIHKLKLWEEYSQTKYVCQIHI